VTKISTEFEHLFMELKGIIYQEGQCANNEGKWVRENGAERKHSSGIVFFLMRLFVYDVVSGNAACPMPLSIVERESDDLYLPHIP